MPDWGSLLAHRYWIKPEFGEKVAGIVETVYRKVSTPPAQPAYGGKSKPIGARFLQGAVLVGRILLYPRMLKNLPIIPTRGENCSNVACQ
jgi:hypothetical protein